MKIRNKLYFLFLIGVLSFPIQTRSQSLPVGTPILEDAYRRAQLLGQIDAAISFVSRPFFPEAALQLKNGFDPYNKLDDQKGSEFNNIFTLLGQTGVVKLLPVTWEQQFNTHHPYSLNDGEMIPARGYQSLFSAGIFAKLGPLSIQLRPEYVYAENKQFDGFPEELSDRIWAGYHNFHNRIDLPERFGDKPYNRLSWGQSSIRLTAGPVSVGLSNENLWWGPGMRNSLLMTNTSGGFEHYTLNTVKPIRTPIGSFEAQIIAGRLDGSGFFPADTNRTWNGGKFYQPKRNDWRYLNGMIISYSPKWVPGLFLGITRSFMIYHEDMGTFPVISPSNKKNNNGGTEIPQGGDQLLSSFIRWVLPKEHAEIYFEYGREDHSYNLRDFILEPDYARAYIFGFRKLFPLTAHPDQLIQFNLEVTQLEQNRTNTQRSAIYFYADPDITNGHGYTNRGQLLGSGIGPGSDMQSVSISWIKSLKMIGLQFERYVHNNDFHYNDVKNIRGHWVDIGAALIIEWDYKNLLFTAKNELTRSMNYEHFYNPDPLDTDFWAPSKDIYNFQTKLGISYRF
ncbi:MAG TPA: capsule assembly Wzi family protein [Prolixibacteraceae bacterium]|nr:capsule assembly Wzi family protein [Prolixibacteraceae bacterium]